MFYLEHLYLDICMLLDGQETIRHSYEDVIDLICGHNLSFMNCSCHSHLHLTNLFSCSFLYLRQPYLHLFHPCISLYNYVTYLPFEDPYLIKEPLFMVILVLFPAYSIIKVLLVCICALCLLYKALINVF